MSFPAERNAKSRNLRVWQLLQINRCQDPSIRLCSLRMTSAFVVVVLWMLMKADTHNDDLQSVYKCVQ